MKQKVREINAYVVLPLLLITGFRFSKDYRWGTTRFHAFIYAWVDVVLANILAGIK